MVTARLNRHVAAADQCSMSLPVETGGPFFAPDRMSVWPVEGGRYDPAAYLLRAVRGLHDAYLENEKVIERRELAFRFALLALGAETLLWALALALT
jgi:hypothetical protein